MSFAIELNEVFASLPPSPTLSINETVARMWKDGQTVYHLGFGESRFPVHPLLSSALNDHAHAKSYLPARGLLELRVAVADYYSQQLGLEVNADQVIIGPGSKALIYALQMALNAELYLPSPSWVSYAPQARMLGKRVTQIPSRVEDGYHLELDAFEKKLRNSKTAQKLLVVNSPNNPTGHILDDEFLKSLAEFCRLHNVLVISDEIYFRINHGEKPHVSMAKHYPEGTFVLGGLSKHLSLAGWRIGVAIVPDSEGGQRVARALESIASETWSAVAAPVQHAALMAYGNHAEIERYIDTCSAIHAIRTKYLAQHLNELGFICTEPQGGFYLTVNVDHWSQALAARGIKTSSRLASHLLTRHHIATLPCDAFGLPEDVFSLRLASSYLDMESDRKAETLLNLYQGGINSDAFMNEVHHPNMHACIDAFASFSRSLTRV